MSHSADAVANGLAQLSVEDAHGSTSVSAASSLIEAGVTPATPAPPTVGFSAVVDIEDLHYVSICGIRRRRPAIVPYLCPFRMHLEPGKLYRYCTCGRSKDQPWCDDSHTHTDPEPIEFSIDVNQSLHWLCGCKYSLKLPYCDGSHIHAVDGYEEVQQSSSSAAAASTPAPCSG